MASKPCLPRLFFQFTMLSKVHTVLAERESKPVPFWFLPSRVSMGSRKFVVVPLLRSKEMVDVHVSSGMNFTMALPEAKSLLYWLDRKSTRLNSSHANISYAVFCLKKKNNKPLISSD